MFIRNLSLKNFRTYNANVFTELEWINSFIGPNNVGKSNIGKVLNFFHLFSKNSINNQNPIFENDIYENKLDQTFVIEVEVQLTDEERKIIMNRLGGKHLLTELEETAILTKIKYKVEFKFTGTLYEELAILNNNNEYTKLIIHQYIDNKASRCISNLRNIISEMRSTNDFNNLLLNDVDTWLPEWMMLKNVEESKPVEYYIGEIIISYFKNIHIFSTIEQNDKKFTDKLRNIQDKWKIYNAILDKLQEQGFQNVTIKEDHIEIKEKSRINNTKF